MIVVGSTVFLRGRMVCCFFIVELIKFFLMKTKRNPIPSFMLVEEDDGSVDLIHPDFMMGSKEKQFIASLGKHEGRVVRAYREAFDVSKEEASDREVMEKVSGLIDNPKISKEIRAMMSTQGITPAYVLNHLTDAVEGKGEFDEGLSGKDKLTALRMLGEYTKIFGKKEEGKGVVNNLIISEATALKLLSRKRANVIEVNE